jgi:hypothetical protein
MVKSFYIFYFKYFHNYNFFFMFINLYINIWYEVILKYKKLEIVKILYF